MIDFSFCFFYSVFSFFFLLFGTRNSLTHCTAIQRSHKSTTYNFLNFNSYPRLSRDPTFRNEWTLAFTHTKQINTKVFFYIFFLPKHREACLPPQRCNFRSTVPPSKNQKGTYFTRERMALALALTAA